jgi:D-alanyl-D-alanine-carboxypeptidase/D-alanyl-D-alanine-endopeptidase
MTTYYAPTQQQLNDIVNSFTQYTQAPSGVAIAIGWSLTGDEPAEDIFLAIKGTLRTGDDNEITPSNHILFKLASTSKLFTATAFAYACQDENSPIRTDSLLGQFIQFTGPMGNTLNNLSLKSLANYTSGLPADNVSSPPGLLPPLSPDTPYCVQEMISFLNKTEFNIEPENTIYQYSNLGFSLLAVAISRAYGTNGFNIWVRDHLFQNDTLQMHDSRYCPIPEEPWPESFPQGYNLDQSNNQYIPITSLYNSKFGAYYGGGGIMSSPHDMLTWLNYNLGKLPEDPSIPTGPLLSMLQNPSTEVRTNNQGYLGLGWFISPDKSILSKNGELPGTNTAIRIAASSDAGTNQAPAGVFVLINMLEVNSTSTDLATQIAIKVLAAMETPS